MTSLSEEFSEQPVQVFLDDLDDYENRTLAINPDDPDVRRMPRLCRFYGLSLEELWRFPRWLLIEFDEQVEKLTAQEQLLAVQTADFPHIPQTDRQRIHRDMMKHAGLYKEAPAIEPTSTQDIRKLAQMGIGVVFEDKKPSATDVAEEITLDA